MAVILEGEAEIRIDGKQYRAKAGEGIVMPSGIPHAVKSVTRFKMLLTVVKNT
jgi:quercetin dioxygenase-like cupin family protein